MASPINISESAGSGDENGENSIKIDQKLDKLDEVEKSEKSTESPYKPTDIVLAKVKGYPPWPAMVLEESILPDNVIKKRPKTKQNKTFILPVRFFSDDTYIWIKSTDMKPLTDDMIDEFFSKVKRRRDNLLDSAYTLAKDPLDMEVFVKYGSSGVPPEPEVIEIEESPKKKKKLTIKLNSGKAPKPKAKSRTKKAPIPPEDVDPDWGIEEDIDSQYDEGNYIFSEKLQEIEFKQNFPTADQLSRELALNSSKFDAIAQPLTRQLLGEFEPGTELLIVQQLDRLQNIPIPKLVVSKSQLLKVIILCNRKGVNGSICKKIDELLDHWFGYAVSENPEEIEEIEVKGEDGSDGVSEDGANNGGDGTSNGGVSTINGSNGGGIVSGTANGN